MPTKKIQMPQEIYQLKVTLLGTSPPIWRRLLVPADLTLAQLHDVLQVAMGWEDEHLHEFSLRGRRIGQPNPKAERMAISPVEDERTVRLSSILVRVRSKAIYTYDFGDAWEHGILLEQRLPMDSNTTYPCCTDGQLACPPEDCGGIPGFYDLLDALNDPSHDRHDERRQWIGDDFDPQAFSVDKVNRVLTSRKFAAPTNLQLAAARRVALATAYTHLIEEYGEEAVWHCHKTFFPQDPR